MTAEDHTSFGGRSIQDESARVSLAWLSVIPVAASFGFVVVVIAPLLARLVSPSQAGFLQFTGFPIQPEPVEQLRYAFFLTTPFAMLAAIWFSKPLANRWRHKAQMLLKLAIACQIVGIVCTVALSVWQGLISPLFPIWSSLVGAVGGVCVSGFLMLRANEQRVNRPLHQGKFLSAMALILVAAVTTIALFPALYHDGNVARSIPDVAFHLPGTMNSFFAVADGRTPLVDYLGQYGNVLPYVLAPVFRMAGLATGSFTAVMVILSVICLCSVFLIFRKLSGTVTALLMYVGFLGLSLYTLKTDGVEKLFNGNFFALLPIRFIGPLLVASLLVWHLGRLSLVSSVALFAASGLTLINELGLGLPSFVGVLFAVGARWFNADKASTSMRSSLARSLLGAGIGFSLAIGSLLLVSALRAGTFPDFRLIAFYPRQYASGYGMTPMPKAGAYVVVGITLAAVLFRGLFRSLSGHYRGSADQLLNGALIYAGVFGLGASAYYVGRSDTWHLAGLFPVWGLALGLLILDGINATRSGSSVTPQARRLWFIPLALASAHLAIGATLGFGFGGLFQQLERIKSSGEPNILVPTGMIEFVERHAHAGEKVCIVYPLSHRIAILSNVQDIYPFDDPILFATEDQLDFFRRRLRLERVERIFVGVEVSAEVPEMFNSLGYRQTETAADLSKMPIPTSGELSLWERNQEK